MKRNIFLGIMFVFALALTTMASAALPAEIQEVQINDLIINPTSTNRLVLERGEEFEVKVILKSLQNLKDVEVEAFISGFEFNNDPKERLSDRTKLFDTKANETRIKVLRLTLPKEVDTDSYKLRIIITDRNNEQLIQNYNLEIEASRHKLTFEDVIFTPGHTVKAGQALLATVRLENKGQKDEEDVKVTVTLPELDVSATDYINEIEKEHEEETEEMYLKLPRCAEPKSYEVKIDVWYNENRDHITKTDNINVVENESCKKENKEDDKKPQIVVVNQPPQNTETVEGASTARRVLEGVLLVLVALLIIVGLIIGFTRLGRED